MQQNKRVLILDETECIHGHLCQSFMKAKFEVKLTHSIFHANEILQQFKPAVLIANHPVTGGNALDFYREIKEAYDMPVIIYTSKPSVLEQIEAYGVGVNNYLIKYTNHRLLIAVVQGELKRREMYCDVPAEDGQWFYFANWRFHSANGLLVSENGNKIILNDIEKKLLAALIEHSYMVLSRDKLLDLARGKMIIACERSIDNHICKLRKYIEINPKQPQIVKTIRGRGYMFMADLKSQVA